MPLSSTTVGGGLNTNASSNATGASTAALSSGFAGGAQPVTKLYGVSIAGVITTIDAPDYEAPALGLARSPRQQVKKPSAVMLK